MATKTITADQLPGGNFVGGGSDTLFLTGTTYETFDLTKASFSGFSTIKTDAGFSIKMTAAQFQSIDQIEGTWYNYLDVIGDTVDIRGKYLSQVWGIGIDENATIIADDISKIDYIDAFYGVGDTLKFIGVLSEAQRNEAHRVGYDIVVDNTGYTTTNSAPTISHLGGEAKLVRPGEIVFLDTNGDAKVSDDRGVIKHIEVYVKNYGDSVRILDTDRLIVERKGGREFYLIFDGKQIGNGSRSSLNDGSLFFNFNEDAPPEAVEHVLHHVQFVRGGYSRYDTEVSITIRDRGGREALAIVTMKGIDGSVTDPGSDPHIPYVPPVKTVDPVAQHIRGGKGKDVLVGTDAVDWIYGDYGNDTLTGRAGQDVFVFSSKLGSSKTGRKVNFDTITDFTVKDDSIWLDNAIFKKLGKKGSEASPAKLDKKFFMVGTKAKDKNDYIVYDKKKGILYYDADGSGSKKAVEIAQLTKNLKLTAADFFVV